MDIQKAVSRAIYDMRTIPSIDASTVADHIMSKHPEADRDEVKLIAAETLERKFALRPLMRPARVRR